MSSTVLILRPTSAHPSTSRRPVGRLLAWAAVAGLLLAGCSHKASVYGLRPLSPPVRIGGMFSGANSELIYPVIDFARPSFQWEPFTPPASIPGSPSGPTNISYDLRIWKVRNGSLGELVYERKSLPMPAHELQKPLEPDTRYFWSVRARFELDGENRLADWSRALQPYNPWIRSDLPSPIPAANYFRFITCGY